MEVKKVPTFAELPQNSIRTVSTPVNLFARESANHGDFTRKVEIALETKNKGSTLLGSTPVSTGEQFAAANGKMTDGESDCQVLRNDGLSGSLASLRTVSTELYIPPTGSRDEFLHDGCVSSLANNLQTARHPTPPEQNVKGDIDKKANCRKRSDNIMRRKRRKKSSQSELAAADVEAVIGMIVSAAEGVVVGHLMEALDIPQTLDRSSILEAALGLRKARQLCGLDYYNLSTTAVDSELVELLEPDDLDMQGAFADVGMNVHLAEDEKQILDAAGAVMVSQRKVEGQERPLVEKNLNSEPPLQALREETLKEAPQACKSVRVSEVKTEESVSEDHEPKEDEMEDREVKIISESERRFLIAGVQEVMLSKQVSDLTPGVMSKCDQSLVGVCGSLEVEIPVVFCDDPKSSGIDLQDTEILEECVMDEVEVRVPMSGATDDARVKLVNTPELVLVPTTYPLEKSGLSDRVEDPVVKCIKQTQGSRKSVELASCKPNDRFAEIVNQAHEASQVSPTVSPERNMICVDTLVSLGSSEGGTMLEANEKKVLALPITFKLGMPPWPGEVESDSVSKLEAMDDAVQGSGTGDLHARIRSPAEALASPLNQSSCPSESKSPKAMTEILVGNTTTSPFVSRWFGGWTGKVEVNSGDLAEEKVAGVQRSLSNNVLDIGSEEAVQQQNASLQYISITFGKETPNTQKGFENPATISQNDEPNLTTDETGLMDRPLSRAGTSSSQLSQVDPLCSFVPCSISPLSERVHDSADIAASVEACALAALNILDSRKKFNCQQPPKSTIETTKPRASVPKTMMEGFTVSRRPTTMRKFSTKTSSLSFLLHAIDVAARALPKDRFEKDTILLPSKRHIPAIEESPAPCVSVAVSVPVDLDQADDCPSAVTISPDATFFGSKKGSEKKQGLSTSDPWMSADVSDSPPLVWARGKKRKLTACRIIESNSMESDDVHTAAAVSPDVETRMEDNTIDGHFVQSISQKICKSSLRSSTRNMFGRQCHDPKLLFKGLQFLLTGFNTQRKQKLSKCIECHGGTLLHDIPAFSPKQRFKRRGIDCGARSPPIVMAPHQVRTPKFLYGCAVGSPLLHANWANASVSARRCLPYHRYQHEQTPTRFSFETNDDSGVGAKSSEGPLFIGLQFLLHGQQDFISQFSNLAKHAGGRVIRKLELNGSAQKKGPKLVGIIVSEGSSNVPLDLQRAAARLEFHVVESEWLVASLFRGRILPFATKSTPPTVNTTQLSSSSKSRELRRCSRRAVVSQNLADEGNGDPGIGLLVKTLKRCALPEERAQKESTVVADSRGANRPIRQPQLDTWLGKGFTSPPQVPQLADGILAPYSHSLAQRKVPRKFLYYEAFLYSDVEYFLGDIVEVQASSADCALSVARIEGLWCEEGRLPQTRAFPQGLRKAAFKDIVLQCRRFYRPSETGFTGRCKNELYLSNDTDNNITASDIVRRVRVAMKVEGSKFTPGNNWYDDHHHRQTAEACHNGVSKATATVVAADEAEYICHFFYDHVRESLHRIKFCE